MSRGIIIGRKTEETNEKLIKHQQGLFSSSTKSNNKSAEKFLGKKRTGEDSASNGKGYKILYSSKKEAPEPEASSDENIRFINRMLEDDNKDIKFSEDVRLFSNRRRRVLSRV